MTADATSTTNAVMRGESGASLAGAQERFEPVLAAAGADAQALGDQLFALSDALDGSGSLRRTLTDPSLPGDAKAAVVRQLLGAFDERVRDLAGYLVERRWARELDLGHAVEHLALEAVLASAQARGALETVEDELFRLTRLLSGDRELRTALSDLQATVENRVTLVDALLVGKVDDVTLLLARRATTNLRHRRFVPNLLSYADIAAERRRRLVAGVTTAVELTGPQLDRLAGILERAYGRAVQLNVTVDTAVLGGLRIQIGSDVIDSTMLSRLADARRRLVS
ncbi:F0F1 ATP synthase subunit delta [Luteimicrobium sp. DT211]|uniref:F0F1 ATP synthase subunit delta n=1 Tax=Luteimicrobium sp. DT211 TaxID=3393412 RepID=UPI003CF51B8A